MSYSKSGNIDVFLVLCKPRLRIVFHWVVYFHCQIITMADSGLDVNSCFFSEDRSEDNIECSTYNNPVFDLTKRKVAAFRQLALIFENLNLSRSPRVYAPLRLRSPLYANTCVTTPHKAHPCEVEVLRTTLLQNPAAIYATSSSCFVFRSCSTSGTLTARTLKTDTGRT